MTPLRLRVDPAFFKAIASKQLDDYDKDLNDLADAVSKGSELRVATNSVELSFNSAQLDIIDAPVSVATDWKSATAKLHDLNSQIADAVSASDYTGITSLIPQAHAQIQAMRVVVGRAG